MDGRQPVVQAQAPSARRTEVRGLRSSSSGQPFHLEVSHMCTADATHAGDAFDPAGRFFSDVPAAVATAAAAMDYINAAVAGLDGSACGELLIALGEVRAKLTAAHAGLLRRFDAADAHDADGYGSSSAWLAAKAGMPKQAARAAVRQMRQLRERPLLGSALAAGDITESLAFTIADWTRK